MSSYSSLNPDRLPLLAATIARQIRADLAITTKPDIAAGAIAALDILHRDLITTANHAGVDTSRYPSRYAPDHKRVIGAARATRPCHAAQLAAHILDAQPELAGKLTRLLRNVAITASSAQSLAAIGEALEAQELAEQEQRLAALRSSLADISLGSLESHRQISLDHP